MIVVAFQVSRDSEITLNNLTLFVGRNSIGKSMVIQAILTFVQEGNSDSAVLWECLAIEEEIASGKYNKVIMVDR